MRWEGPARAGEQEGLKLPCFGWEAGRYTQGTACGIFGTAPRFPCSPPSLQAILPTVSASGSPTGAPCGQVSRPLGRGPDRGLRERGAGERALDHQIAALPPEPHQEAAGHGGLGEGDTADRPPGIPAELGDRLVTRSSVQLESEPPVLGHTSLSHLWQVMPPGYLVPPSPSSASAPGSPPSSAPG